MAKNSNKKDNGLNDFMLKGFDANHKDFELLRFYISKDIKRIEKKIPQGESQIVCCMIASLIDLLIAYFFKDILSNYAANAKMGNLCNVILRMIAIIVLIVMFLLLSKMIKRFLEYRKRKKQISGELLYSDAEYKQEIIDDFDNIACDGLLICQNYIAKYHKEQKDYIKEFYLYEVLHHLTKSLKIFDIIYENSDQFVSDKDDNLIDSYRAKNFVIFAQEIYVFLEKECKKADESGIKTVLINMDAKISKFKRML